MKVTTLTSTLAFLSCGALCCILAGCGGDENSGTSSSSSTTSSTAGTSTTSTAAPSAPQVGSAGGGGAAPSGGAASSMHGAAGGGGEGDMYENEGLETAGENAGAAEQYGQAPSQYGQAPGSGPAVPSRPEELADWTEKDLREAIEERDKKAPEAIVAFAKKIDGDAEGAGQLVSFLPILLEPPRKPKPVSRGYGPGGYPPGGAPGGSGPPGMELGTEPYEDPTQMAESTTGGDMYGTSGGGVGTPLSIDQQIAQALVESIIGSHTLIGYQTARGLLKGDVQIGQEDELVASWTLSSLMKSFSGSAVDPAEKILFQTLAKAQILRPDPGDFDAKKLEKTSLVQHAADAISIIDGLMGLSTMELLNIKRGGSAQYGSGDPAEMYAGTEPGGGAYPGSEGGGANKLDIKPEIPPVPKDFPITDFSSTQSRNATNYLWSEDMLTFVNRRLGESETLMKTPELVLLAGQIPHSSTRQGLKQFFEKNWEMTDEWTRNPAPLITDKVFEKYMRDPGLLITLKSLPREQSTQQQSGGDPYGSGDPGAETGAAPESSRSRNRDRGKSVDSPEQVVAKGAWFNAAQNVMLAWMDRATKGANAGNSGHRLEELPFKLHRDAEASKSFRLELTCRNGDRTEVTKLNYLRFDLPSDISPNQAKQIARHYDSAMKRGEEYIILGKSGMWYDWVSTESSTGEIVSADVLLSQNGARKIGGSGQPGGQSGGTPQFAVEILVIRVTDPEANVPAGVVSQ